MKPIARQKPMPIYKRCGRCGARIPAGQSCPKCKRLYARKDLSDHVTRFYASGAWAKARELCKARCNGIDWYEYSLTGRVVTGDVVHHIIPVRDDFSRRFDVNNLIFLTNSNHQLVHIELAASPERREKIIADLRDALKRGRGE